LLRPVLPHLRTRIPKVENIKMPVAYGIEKPRFVRPNRQATALPGKQATDTRPKSRADDKPRHPGQKKGRPTSGSSLFLTADANLHLLAYVGFLGNLRGCNLGRLRSRGLRSLRSGSLFRCGLLGFAFHDRSLLDRIGLLGCGLARTARLGLGFGSSC